MNKIISNIAAKYVPAVLIAATTILPAHAEGKLKGVYLRAEGGLSISGTAKFKVEGNKAGWESPNQNFTRNIGKSSVFGVGVGHRFTKLFRADLSYRQRDNFDYSKKFAALPGRTYTRSHNMKNKSLTVDGYIDTASLGFGTECINPYAGVGLGMSWNRLQDAVTLDTPNAGGAPITYPPIKGKTKTSFTWSATVGTGIKVAQQLTLDVGYRYVNMGTFETGNAAPDLAVLAPLRAKNVPTHEMYLGLRFAL